MSTVKVMVSFPEEFLKEVDRLAAAEHRSRSELLREAIRLYMEIQGRSGSPGQNPVVQRAIAQQERLARLTPGKNEDSTDEIARWRQIRHSQE